jgi:predicted  nucleic acid-binding Zn-ribbon protein
MLPELSSIAKLDELDAEVHRLHSRLAELPKLAAARKKASEERRKHLTAEQGRLQALDKERKQWEVGIQVRQDKAAKLKKQIEQASTEAQLAAFQKEIEYLRVEIGKDEDRVLARMEELEALETALRAEQSATERDARETADLLRSAEAEYKEGQERLKADAASRQSLLEQLPREYASLYDRLRKKYKSGPVITEVTEGSCGVCQMVLRPAFFQQMKMEPDALYLCEECGRILHYNAPIPVRG